MFSRKILVAEKFLNFHTVKGRPSFTSSLQHFIWTVMSQEKRFSKFSTSSSFTFLWGFLKWKEELIESSWNACSIHWKIFVKLTSKMAFFSCNPTEKLCWIRDENSSFVRWFHEIFEVFSLLASLVINVISYLAKPKFLLISKVHHRLDHLKRFLPNPRLAKTEKILLFELIRMAAVCWRPLEMNFVGLNSWKVWWKNLDV